MAKLGARRPHEVAPTQGRYMSLLNRIAWWELVGRDWSAANRVYSTLGWQAKELGLRQRYRVWTAAGQGRAGWVALPEEALAAGALPHWIPCVPVADLQKTVTCAERLAGQVVLPPTRFAHLGQLATVVDPQGAAVTLLQPTGALKRRLWRGPAPVLTAMDPEALAPFYAQLLGWKRLGADEGKVVLALDQQPVAELALRSLGAPPLWLPRWPQHDSQVARDRWEFCGGKRIDGVLVDGEGVPSLAFGAPLPGE